MTPIINPWWFYLFDMVEKLNIVSMIVAISICVYSIIYSIVWFEVNNKIKFNKLIITIFIISIIFSIFTPSKETCYQMAAASFVTPDNLTTAGGVATDIIDYIVDSVDKILDEE